MVIEYRYSTRTVHGVQDAVTLCGRFDTWEKFQEFFDRESARLKSHGIILTISEAKILTKQEDLFQGV